MVKKPSLAETHPGLAAQANGWDPATVTAGSHRRLNWRCLEGHEFTAEIKSRALGGSGCATCSGKKVLVGFNDLATTHPELAAQAEGWDATTLAAGSNRKVGWKCELGHVWTAIVGNRSRGSGCPFCSNNSILIGFNDLAAVFPQLALQANGWDPTSVTSGSNRRLSWKCESGHEWLAPVKERTKDPDCPACTGSTRRLIQGFSDLASKRPDLAIEAYGWDPSAKTFGSGETVQWRCSMGHIYKATINGRTSQDWNCPVCSNKRLLPGFNDLKNTHPHLSKEMVDDPSRVMAGESKKVLWLCSLGHSYHAAVKERTGNHATGCPICTGRKVLSGFNDIATTHPSIASEIVGANPKELSAGSNTSVRWRCQLGHVYRAVVSSRCGDRKSGCPYCAGKKVLIGYNDLQTVAPDIAARAFGWDPTSVTISSGKKMTWKCEKNHVFKQVVAARTGQDRGCPICSGNQVLAGFNDLATLRPNLAAEAHEWDPSTVTISSGKKKLWVCEKGHRWPSTVASRSDGHGCPSCAYSGFDPNRNGWIYLIDHFELEMFQIGISNFPDNRLKDHKRRGWDVIELRGPMDGHLTQKLETDCLHALEKRGAILGHKAGIEKFDGYSEAWTKASLEISSIKQILDWVYEDESVPDEN